MRLVTIFLSILTTSFPNRPAIADSIPEKRPPNQVTFPNAQLANALFLFGNHVNPNLCGHVSVELNGHVGEAQRPNRFWEFNFTLINL